MLLQMHCPECGHPREAGPSLIGAQVTCMNCGQSFDLAVRKGDLCAECGKELALSPPFCKGCPGRKEPQTEACSPVQEEICRKLDALARTLPKKDSSSVTLCGGDFWSEEKVPPSLWPHVLLFEQMDQAARIVGAGPLKSFRQAAREHFANFTKWRLLTAVLVLGPVVAFLYALPPIAGGGFLAVYFGFMVLVFCFDCFAPWVEGSTVNAVLGYDEELKNVGGEAKHDPYRSGAHVTYRVTRYRKIHHPLSPSERIKRIRDEATRRNGSQIVWLWAWITLLAGIGAVALRAPGAVHGFFLVGLVFGLLLLFRSDYRARQWERVGRWQEEERQRLEKERRRLENETHRLAELGLQLADLGNLSGAERHEIEEALQSERRRILKQQGVLLLRTRVSVVLGILLFYGMCLGPGLAVPSVLASLCLLTIAGISYIRYKGQRIWWIVFVWLLACLLATAGILYVTYKGYSVCWGLLVSLLAPVVLLFFPNRNRKRLRETGKKIGPPPRRTLRACFGLFGSLAFVALVLAVLYPFSYGPAGALNANGYLSDHALSFAYAPLLRGAKEWEQLDTYLDQWAARCEEMPGSLEKAFSEIHTAKREPQPEPSQQRERQPAADLDSQPEEQPSVESDGFRIWADNTSQSQTEAEFVAHEGDTVKLRKRNGQLVELPLERLSNEDQEWINKKHGREEVEADSVVVVIREGAELWVGNDAIGTLGKGAKLTVLEVKGDWIGVTVELDGEKREGWVKSGEVEGQLDSADPE